MSTKNSHIDVIEALQEKICFGCPHFGNICMPNMDEEGDNIEQMIECVNEIDKRANGEYPNAEDVIPFEE
jgi:hypothetical protein